MSGDKLRRASTSDQVGKGPDERLTPLVDGRDTENAPSSTDRDPVPDALLSAVAESVTDGDVSVADGLVTQSLDEILLALIASTADETHGTGLMDELVDQLDAELSPGTVYPRLHDLEADGLLEMHELVQTKQYAIDDRSAARDRIERAVSQHLAIGLFLQASLDDL